MWLGAGKVPRAAWHGQAEGARSFEPRIRSRTTARLDAETLLHAAVAFASEHDPSEGYDGEDGHRGRELPRRRVRLTRHPSRKATYNTYGEVRREARGADRRAKGLWPGGLGPMCARRLAVPSRPGDRPAAPPGQRGVAFGESDVLDDLLQGLRRGPSSAGMAAWAVTLRCGHRRRWACWHHPSSRRAGRRQGRRARCEPEARHGRATGTERCVRGGRCLREPWFSECGAGADGADRTRARAGGRGVAGGWGLR